MNNFVSSANISIPECTRSGISLTNIINNSGPMTLPCGIPLRTIANMDRQPSMDTCCFLPFKKSEIQHQSFPWMPYCLSFRSSHSCGTESKHFEKSKYTASISPPLSITSVQWSNVAKSWVMHERPLIKPCWQEVSRLLLTRWSVTTSRMSCSSTFPTTEVRLTGL